MAECLNSFSTDSGSHTVQISEPGQSHVLCTSQLYMIQKNLDSADRILLKCDLDFVKIEDARSWIEQTQPSQSSSIRIAEDQGATWPNFVAAAVPSTITARGHGLYHYFFRGQTMQITENVYRYILWARQQCHFGPERAAWYTDTIQRALIALPFVQSARNIPLQGTISPCLYEFMILTR